jgi:hypothetical protein
MELGGGFGRRPIVCSVRGTPEMKTGCGDFALSLIASLWLQ